MTGVDDEAINDDIDQIMRDSLRDANFHAENVELRLAPDRGGAWTSSGQEICLLLRADHAYRGLVIRGCAKDGNVPNTHQT
jgi:hypothetical protein